MSDQSPRLGLPYVRAGQLQKHVTVNEGLTRLDALVQTAVTSRGLNVPPQVAEEGEIYIIGPAPTGGWADFEAGEMVVADIGGWRSFLPSEGQLAFILSEQTAVVWHAGQWVSLAQFLGSSLTVETLGIAATPDASNPFSARLNKALWAARPTSDGGDGDLRFTFNKQATSHTASMLFQSDWRGCAEIGLTGDDDLRLKVSGDGTAWHEAFRADASDGRMWFAKGATRRETVLVTANMTLQLPEWVRWVEATAFGGGGGGASGSYGSAANLRMGGGGGGAGGTIQACWSREHLGASITILVGAAGTGGVAGNGGMGGASLVSAHGSTILRASGGNGGQTNGTAGTGGLGELISNNGGACSGDGVAQTGQSSTRPVSSGGGGAGGGLNAAGTARAGAAGAIGGLAHVMATGGAVGAAGGNAPLVGLCLCGGGGGGGNASATAKGDNGGAGGLYGAGGGGGGAGLTAGGNGGAGGAGAVFLTLVG